VVDLIAWNTGHASDVMGSNPARTPAMDTKSYATFSFVAHIIDTERTIDVKIKIEDDGTRPYVDMADEAEEKAYRFAAEKLSSDNIEVMSA
jgi:hypothetical protein